MAGPGGSGVTIDGFSLVGISGTYTKNTVLASDGSVAFVNNCRFTQFTNTLQADYRSVIMAEQLTFVTPVGAAGLAQYGSTIRCLGCNIQSSQSFAFQVNYGSTIRLQSAVVASGIAYVGACIDGVFASEHMVSNAATNGVNCQAVQPPGCTYCSIFNA